MARTFSYNRTLHVRKRELGGTGYPITAVRPTRRYDPGNVFFSGPDILEAGRHKLCPVGRVLPCLPGRTPLRSP